METKTNYLPPWDRSGAFGDKPSGSEYGFIRRGKSIACTRAELVTQCQKGAYPQIDVVWHPDASQLVLVDDVPFLSGALKTRIKRELKWDLAFSLCKLVLFGAMTVYFRAQRDESLLYAILAAVTGAIPFFNGLRNYRYVRRPEWEVQPADSAQRWRAWVKLRPLTYTYLLGASLIVVWLFQYHSGEDKAAHAAGLYKPEVWQGEWWRLLTGTLVHGSWLHLFFNVLALYGLGRLTEVLASRFHLALVFITSALFGSIFSLFLLPEIPTVGASGGLLGLFGFLVVLGLRHRSLLPRGFTRMLMLNIGLIAAMGAMLHAMVDNAAHFGGLMGGVLAGMILVKRNDTAVPLKVGAGLWAAGHVAMLVTLVGLVLAVVKIAERAR